MSKNPPLNLGPATDQNLRAKAKALFLAGGKTITAVAEEVGLPRSTVASFAARENWRAQLKIKEELPEASAEVVQERAKSERPIYEPSDLDLSERQEIYQSHMGTAAERLAAHVATLSGEELVKFSDKILKADTTARKSLKLDRDVPSVLINIGVLSGTVRPAKEDDGRLRSTRSPVQLVEGEQTQDTKG
jgi:transposase